MFRRLPCAGSAMRRQRGRFCRASRNSLKRRGRQLQRSITLPRRCRIFFFLRDDLEERKRIESLLLSALAHHGFGDRDRAIAELRQVTAEDPNHQVALFVRYWTENQERLAAAIESAVRPSS